MGKEWLAATSLDTQMTLAAEAAAQLDLLALLPPDMASSQHHPLSSNQSGFDHPPPPQPQRNPDAMEIDAIRMTPTFRFLLDISRLLCRARNLCFQCLSPIVPGTHTGSLNCPNPPISSERRQAFINKSQNNSPAQVNSIHLSASTPSPLTYQPVIPQDPFLTPLKKPHWRTSILDRRLSGLMSLLKITTLQIVLRSRYHWQRYMCVWIGSWHGRVGIGLGYLSHQSNTECI
ncbi:uncharacterized protein VP01_2082g1 [Puccinia sorghi]|uniref:Uncharacterized protein n=1 Tax=Puccinia sorghi TaxID=27349 RepID=A0A0L6VC79_9BASI|nr:uncharacterized protein VP01_2082g1 [Puccinia sorghi]